MFLDTDDASGPLLKTETQNWCKTHGGARRAKAEDRKRLRRAGPTWWPGWSRCSSTRGPAGCGVQTSPQAAAHRTFRHLSAARVRRSNGALRGSARAAPGTPSEVAPTNSGLATMLSSLGSGCVSSRCTAPVASVAIVSSMPASGRSSASDEPMRTCAPAAAAGTMGAETGSMALGSMALGSAREGAPGAVDIESRNVVGRLEKGLSSMASAAERSAAPASRAGTHPACACGTCGSGTRRMRRGR
jgi:hypothetical protein